MKLSITLAAAAVILRFTTPGPGTFYIYKMDSRLHGNMISSGHPTNACHVSVTVPMNADVGLYHLQFVEDAP